MNTAPRARAYTAGEDCIRLCSMRVSHLVTRHYRSILVLAALLVLPSLSGIKRTEIEYNILSYLPHGLESIQGEEILDKDFGEASSAFLIVENKSLKELLAAKAELASVDGVLDVIGFDDIVSPNIPIELLPEAIRETFFSSRGNLLIVRFADSSGSMRTQTATARIRSLLGEDAYLSSLAATSLDTRSLVEKEMPAYLGLAFAIVTLILGLTLGSWLIPPLFLAEIGLAIVYNLGSNVFLGKISFVSQALAAILQLGVTMDFSIFLLHRYEEERGPGGDQAEAMARAIDKTFQAILGSAVTDVAGFMALCAMSLGLGFDIGVVMSKGVVIGLAGVLTVLPALLLAFDHPIHRFKGRPIVFDFRSLSLFVSRHSLPLALLFFLLFIPAVHGKNNVVQDYNLMGTLPEDLPSTMADRKLRTDFHMMTSHFVIVRDDLPPVAIRDMIARFEKVEGVSGVIALEKYLGALIPEEFLPESVKTLFRHGGKEIMLISSIYSVSMPEENRQLDEIMAIAKSFDPGCLVTGEGALHKELVEVAAADFKRVDMVSLAAISIIVLILFTSVSIPLFLVGAIELAIIANIAIPFYLGQSVPILSSIVIGCIQLGCTIDYSILLISRFKEELWAGLAKREAMAEALRKSAPSILTSSLILCSATAAMGFITSLSLLKSICALISRGAVISMAVVFLLLPAILIRAEGMISVTSLRWRRPQKRG